MNSSESFMELFHAHRAKTSPPPDKVHFEGQEAIATSPEGREAKMPLGEFLQRISPSQLHQANLIFPFGIKAVIPRGAMTILVYEHGPGVFNFKWIAPDSPRPYGPGTQYRRVRIALPYLIVLAVFVPGPGGLPQLSSKNECFFRVSPLTSMQDALLYPALLNCSKFRTQQGQPLSWICTQHLSANGKMKSQDANQRFWGGFEALRHCLLETAFNLSSEHHEGSSWFSESRQVDPRVASVEAWQEATTADPHFVLDVPWLKTGHTLGQVVDRIFNNLRNPAHDVATVAALARIIFNHAP